MHRILTELWRILFSFAQLLSCASSSCKRLSMCIASEPFRLTLQCKVLITVAFETPFVTLYVTYGSKFCMLWSLFPFTSLCRMLMLIYGRNGMHGTIFSFTYGPHISQHGRTFTEYNCVEILVAQHCTLIPGAYLHIQFYTGIMNHSMKDSAFNGYFTK